MSNNSTSSFSVTRFVRNVSTFATLAGLTCSAIRHRHDIADWFAARYDRGEAGNEWTQLKMPTCGATAASESKNMAHASSEVSGAPIQENRDGQALEKAFQSEQSVTTVHSSGSQRSIDSEGEKMSEEQNSTPRRKGPLCYREKKDKCEQLHSELSKWFFMDIKEVHRILSLIDEEGQRVVADYYGDEYAILLDTHLEKKLDGSDLEVAKKLRQGAVAGTVEAVQFRRSIAGFGANQAGVRVALGNKSPEQMKQIAREYQRLYGESLEDALFDQWTIVEEWIHELLNQLRN